MRILVTGAAGFIGRHVIKELVDNYPQYKIVAIGRKLRDGQKSANVTYKSFDLCLANDQNQVLNGDYDIMIHLAWDKIHDYNNEQHLTQILPAQKLFLSKAISQIGSIVVIGTCFEYGLQQGELFETADTKPNTAYGKAKDLLRRYAFDQSSKFDSKIKWLRPFYLYGKGQSKSSLIPQLERAIENNEINFNMSGGQQIRDYMKVDLLANYIVKIAFLKEVEGIYNCCSNQPVTLENFIRDYIETYHKHCKINLNLGHFPYNPLEPMEFWGNNEKLLSLFKN